MSNIVSTVDGKMFLPRDPFPHSFPGKQPILKDLLKVVPSNPAIVESTHQGACRMSFRDGVDEEATNEARRVSGNDNLVAFKRITSKFFGVEEAVYDILVGYASQAAEGGRAHRKALIIPGAPGAGKSDFVNFLQRDVMRSREPMPFLLHSVNFANPLNALYLAKIIAQTKAKDIEADTIVELVKVIDGLDLRGESKLDVSNPDLQAVVRRYDIEVGKELTSEDLAKICMISEKDFVKTVCFGLGVSVATVDSLSPSANLIDPWTRDVVLGEFFGKFGPNAPALTEWSNELAEKGKPQAKNRKHETYGEYDPRYAAELGEYPIGNYFMSKGQGIVDVAEVQPINFDIAVWRGSKKLATMGLYEDRDPRTVSPTGYFNVGKFMVLTEIFRNPPEGFRVLLESLEGGRLPLPEPLASFYPEGVHWEGVLIGHANMEQWTKFYGNPDHRAHLDRFSPRPFTYPLRPSAATKVTEKLYNSSNFGKPTEQGGVHHEPLAFQYSGYFRVATHLDIPSKGNRPLLAVLRAYDGKKVREPMMGTDIDLAALRAVAPTSEGQTGMSPRWLDDIIGKLASEALTAFRRNERPSPCFTTAELRERLKLSFKTDDSMPKKLKEQWIGWLDNEFETFRRRESTKVYKAAFIPNYRDMCMQLIRKYTALAKALAAGVRPIGSFGSMTDAQKESFLQEIERADEFNVNSAQAPKFRSGILAAINLYNEEHGTSEPPYEEMPEGLRNAVESYVLRKAQDVVGVIGGTTIDEEAQKKIDDAKKRLIDEHGYCPYCAAKLLTEVALTRDFLKA